LCVIAASGWFAVVRPLTSLVPPLLVRDGVRTGVPPVELSPARDEDEWDAALAGRDGVTAFHRWRWLHLQASLHDWQFIALVARSGGRVVGAVPVLLQRRGVLRKPAPAPFPYVGPVVDPDAFDATLRALVSWSARRGVPVQRVDLHRPTAAQVTALEARRSLVDQGRTYIVDLSHGSEEQLLAGLSRSARYNVSRARREGIQVRPASREDVSSMLPRLLDEAFAARGEPSPYPPEVGSAFHESFGDTDDACALGAYWPDGRCIGVLTALGDTAGAYGWAGGCLREFRHTRVNSLLTLSVLLWALERGYSFFDMVGEVDEGVAQFKRSFGAQPASMVIAIVPASRTWRLAKAALRRLRVREVVSAARSSRGRRARRDTWAS
jgi:Acetyltransferase (GNAT) domain